MATAVYSFVPGTTVWHLTDDCGVKEGIVKIVNIRVLEVTGSPAYEATPMYDVQYSGESGTTEVVGEDKLFADVATALAAYQVILEA